MAIEFPWPEDPARTEARLRGLVASVVHDHELRVFRLEWVTPFRHSLDFVPPDHALHPGHPANPAGWCALRLTICGPADDDTFEQEIWGPDRHDEWESVLGELASRLEDWVSETRFGWGQQRDAVVPD